MSWSTSRLEQLTSRITDGSHNPPKGVDSSDFMMLSSKNVFDDNLHFENPRFLSAKDHATEDKRTALRSGDVLLTIVGTVGRSAVVPIDAPKLTLQRSVAVLGPDPERIDSRFLMYALIEKSEEMNVKARGVAQKGIYLEQIRQFAINHPLLPEQRRIVGILDEAFAGIAAAKANAEKNLRNARALFASEREEVLNRGGAGWKELSLAELCTIKHGFAFRSEFFTEGGEHVLLTPGNFFETGGYRDRGDKQKYYEGEIPDGFILGEGDLLVVMTEQAAGLLGSPILVPESNRFLHNQRLGLVEGKPGVPWTNEFFFHVFNLKPVRDELHHTGTGLKVRHTSPTKIGDVRVSFPCTVADQKKVAARLVDLHAETQRLASLYQQKLAALDALKKSLLHQAFSGQLTS